MVAQASNPSSRRQRQADLCLLYRVSSRAMLRNPVSLSQREETTVGGGGVGAGVQHRGGDNSRESTLSYHVGPGD